jgi:hypothetical protein
MKADGVVAVRRRRSRAEGERLVCEFEQSGLGRKEFCAARGLNVFTLDAWRKRVAQSKGPEKIVPVEIVEERTTDSGSMRSGSVASIGRFRIVLADGLGIEVDSGFDATELRRLVAALDHRQLHSGLSRTV